MSWKAIFCVWGDDGIGNFVYWEPNVYLPNRCLLLCISLLRGGLCGVVMAPLRECLFTAFSQRRHVVRNVGAVVFAHVCCRICWLV